MCVQWYYDNNICCLLTKTCARFLLSYYRLGIDERVERVAIGFGITSKKPKELVSQVNQKE